MAFLAQGAQAEICILGFFIFFLTPYEQGDMHFFGLSIRGRAALAQGGG